MLINILLDFVIIFVLIYLFYVLFINKRKMNYELLRDSDFIKIFVNRYNINIDKVNYKYMINLIALINSFIIAFTSVIILKIENVIWSIIVCFVVLFILVYSLFEIAGKHIKNMETKKKVKKNKKKKEDEK